MSFPRVLAVHNRYLLPGGEDTVFDQETQLLRQYGLEVTEYVDDNARLQSLGVIEQIRSVVWSERTERELSATIREFRPDVAHFHNISYAVSASAYGVCRAFGVPVVQTLHNFRFGCIEARFMRRGSPCFDCMRVPGRALGVVRACFKQSRLKSLGVLAALRLQYKASVEDRGTAVFIALSEAARRLHEQNGIPADKLLVKPNCVCPDPGEGPGDSGYALFVGAVIEEKGILTLLESWNRLKWRIPLKVAGTGALRDLVVQVARDHPTVEYLGQRNHSEVLDLMKRASVLVFPSLCIENFPMTIAEAFATGLPVVCSAGGAMLEIVEHGRTGMHFAAGDAMDLAAKIAWIFDNPELLQKMRKAARTEFETKYTGVRNFEMLLGAYEKAMRG